MLARHGSAGQSGLSLTREPAPKRAFGAGTGKGRGRSPAGSGPASAGPANPARTDHGGGPFPHPLRAGEYGDEPRDKAKRQA